MSAGIYVHVPFCLTRCGYCDFNAYAGLDHLRGRYVAALMREAELAAPAWSNDEVVSIFLGGGTPTTLEVEDLAALLRVLRASFRVTNGAEVTNALLRAQVIVDYRPNAGIRIAPHFYTSDEEVDRAITTIDEALTTGGWREYETARAVVT